MPLSLGLGLRLATLSTGGGAPAGFSRTTYNGQPVTYLGRPVFDNGANFYVRAA